MENSTVTATFANRIELDDRGIAWIAGTKVTEVILDRSPTDRVRRRSIFNTRISHWLKSMAHRPTTMYQVKVDEQIEREAIPLSVALCACDILSRPLCDCAR